MAAATIARRRLAAQRLGDGGLASPADVVRWLAAVQAQDYHQALWAIGSRLRKGTRGQVESAIAERQIVRTWLMRGTIHLAAPEDVRALLALCAPRLATAEARRREQLGLTAGELELSAEVLRAALSGDRRLSRPDVFRLLEDAGVATTGQRGYHVLVRLAHDGLICFGPMEGTQSTFVLLDDWVPRAAGQRPTRELVLADLASRFVASRGPVTDADLARWLGVTLADARAGLGAAPVLIQTVLEGVGYWVVADQAGGRAPRAGRDPALLLAGFDEFVLGYKDRDAQLPQQHAAKVVPGANGIFKPMIVIDGQVVGTWARLLRPNAVAVALRPFADGIPDLADRVRGEVERYRDFLGLSATCVPAVVVEGPA